MALQQKYRDWQGRNVHVWWLKIRNVRTSLRPCLLLEYPLVLQPAFQKRMPCCAKGKMALGALPGLSGAYICPESKILLYTRIDFPPSSIFRASEGKASQKRRRNTQCVVNRRDDGLPVGSDGQLLRPVCLGEKLLNFFCPLLYQLSGPFVHQQPPLPLPTPAPLPPSHPPVL
jgi:hypothetical protein